MFIIDETVFTGDIAIPQLPSSRINEDWATYGAAKVIQSVGETNLGTFIDDYTTSYLRLMLGDTLCNLLAETWFEYTQEIGKFQTLALIIDDTTDKNIWFPIDLVFDINFSNLTLDGNKPTIERRFGESRRFIWTLSETLTVKARLRSDSDVAEVYISTTSPIINEMFLEEVHNIGMPSFALCKLLNKLVFFNGEKKCSPIANYVYYHLNKDAQNGTTVMGEADMNFSRATSAYEADKYLKTISARNRLINAWNDMSIMNISLSKFLAENHELYSTYNIPFQNHKYLCKTINSFNL